MPDDEQSYENYEPQLTPLQRKTVDANRLACLVALRTGGDEALEKEIKRMSQGLPPVQPKSAFRKEKLMTDRYALIPMEDDED